MSAVAALLLAQLEVVGMPVASIGVVDGDTMQMLSRVMTATEDHRGNLFVVQRNIPYVAVFDSTGRRVATLGRGGGGPGEFMLPTFTGFSADSIWITDLQLNKYSLYGPDFTHVRDVVVQYEYPAASAALEGGNSVSVGQAGRWGFAFEARAAGAYASIWQPWLDKEISDLARFRPGDRHVIVTVDGRTTTVISPIVETPIVVARDTLVLLLERASSLSISRVDQDGRAGPAVRIKLNREAVPGDLEETFVSSLVETMKGVWSSSSRARSAQLLRREIELPDSSYFVRMASIEADGHLWLRQAIPNEPIRMHRIGADGTVLNTFIVPDGKYPAALSERHVWLLEYDDADVPFLRKYRVGPN